MLSQVQRMNDVRNNWENGFKGEWACGNMSLRMGRRPGKAAAGRTRGTAGTVRERTGHEPGFWV